MVAGAGAIATIGSAVACGSQVLPTEGVASMPEDAGDAGPDALEDASTTECDSVGLCGDAGGAFSDVTSFGVVDAPQDGVADGSQEAATPPADGGEQ